MLFRAVEIPAGSTIDEAFVQFAVDVVKPGVTDAVIALKVSAAKEASAADITEADFSISSRPRTEAKVDWSPGPSVAEGDQTAAEKTSNIAAVIQEVVNQDGWVSGNNILVVIEGDAAQTEDLNREYESFDGDALLAPKLSVTWSEGGGGGGEPVSIAIQISDIMDDVEEAGEEWAGTPIGTIDDSSSDLEFINEDGLQVVGMIFRNVQIPPNETINSAYIQFYSDKALDGPVTCELYGAAEANVAAPFTSELFNVSIKPSTVASVSWTPGPWGEAGVATEAERSPDISAIIQEIVGIEGWAAGNNLMIGARGTATGKIDNREAVSFDGNPLQAPILNVTYGGPDNTRVQPKHAELSSLIYPNPTEGKLYINNPSEDRFDYEIYTISGRMILSKQNNTGSTTEVDMSDFVKGMYFVNVRSEGISETHKLILK
jgi:hypothetical protein